ncbi:hypothetical protein ACFQ05_30385 [Amycolatopsis umgeniensis]|uniref:Uncharacterized protein n=1 Tax=Amycolatopsis umgeniensis TaxID=336628 RepID=A0A841BF62_9PSEU|nr:hypothetical protein [Amycolatopsis umgeniensis]MBB5857212.1 hypothetical protein [Amycolatopsis umgeniensis]
MTGLDGLDEQLIAQLLSSAKASGLKLTGEGGVLQQLTKRLLESALEGEITDHLGYQISAVVGGGLAPFIMVLLLESTGTSMSVSLYIIVLALISLGSIGLLAKRAKRAAQSTSDSDDRAREAVGDQS